MTETSLRKKYEENKSNSKDIQIDPSLVIILFRIGLDTCQP
jgi:hypothetical protein